MSWSKAKNIIILILLAANVLLGAIALPLWQRQTTESRQLGHELETLFAARGLSLDASILPAEQTLGGLELRHGSDGAARAITALLGQSILIQTDSNRYQSVYTGPGGDCVFSHNSDFSARITRPPIGTGHPLSDARTLLDYAFANYTLITPRTEALPAVEVTLGTEESVQVVCGDSGRVLMEKALQSSLEPTVELAERVNAPVAAGQRLGTLTLSANGKAVAEVPLLAAGSVDRLGFLQIWTQLVRTLCGQE